jgi:hypothetical protein
MARVRIEQQQHPSPAVASTKLSENHTEIHRALPVAREQDSMALFGG